MIKKISLFLSSILCNYIELDKQKHDIIRFVLEVIISDSSKILIILIASSFLGYRFDLIIVLLFSFPLRFNIGGFHLKKYCSCLIFSSSYLLAIYYINKYLHVTVSILIIVAVLCSFIIFMIAPIIPSERIGASTTRFKQLKLRASFLIFLYIALFTIANNPYTRYGIWVIILQTILLLFAKGVKTNENKFFIQTISNTF